MIASSYKDRRWYKEYLKSKKPEFKIEDKSTWGYYMKDETRKDIPLVYLQNINVDVVILT